MNQETNDDRLRWWEWISVPSLMDRADLCDGLELCLRLLRCVQSGPAVHRHSRRVFHHLRLLGVARPLVAAVSVFGHGGALVVFAPPRPACARGSHCPGAAADPGDVHQRLPTRPPQRNQPVSGATTAGFSGLSPGESVAEKRCPASPGLAGGVQCPAARLLPPAAAKQRTGFAVLPRKNPAHLATRCAACAAGRGAGAAGVAAIHELFLKLPHQTRNQHDRT